MNGITEKRAARVDERFRFIFDSVADGIFLCDAETGRLMDVNATACEMFGLSRDELIGRPLESLSTGLSPLVQRDLLTLLGEARSRGPQIFEWLCKTKDERLFWGEVSLRFASLGGRPVGLAVLRDISERKRKDDEVVQLAHFDVLTGLPNRRNFDVTLRQDIARSKRYGGALSVAMCDIDHFKVVNDTFGHQAGDAVLKSLADLMRNSLRQSDYIARWGGEEFTLLLTETGPDASELLLNRVRSNIADRLIPEIGQPVTVSFGVTAYAKPETPDTLMSRVDQALYLSKQTGRNKVTRT